MDFLYHIKQYKLIKKLFNVDKESLPDFNSHSPGGHDAGTAAIPYSFPEPPGGGAREADSTPE